MARCPLDAVTPQQYPDGFGVQYASMMLVYDHALQNNLTFCTRAWEEMKHFPRSSYAESALFAFVGGAALGPEARITTRALSGKPSCYTPGHELGSKRAACSHLPSDTARLALRKTYLTMPKPQLRHYNASQFSIAVHIRRGDVDGSRLTSNADVLRCLRHARQRVRPVAGGREVAIHLFSEGADDDFEPVVTAARARFGNIALHLSAPYRAQRKFDSAVSLAGLEEAFHHLVMADAMVMAESEFSWAAAALRRPEHDRGRLFFSPSSTEGAVSSNGVEPCVSRMAGTRKAGLHASGRHNTGASEPAHLTRVHR